MQAVYEKHSGEFEILILAVDSGGDPAGYMKQQGYTMTSGLDGDGYRKYGTGSIPLTVFIDKSGNLVEKKVGGMSETEFESLLSKIL